MASIKSITAAVDNVAVNDRRTHTNQWAGTKKAGYFRSSGFTQVEVIDLVLTGRLGRLEVAIEIATDHAHTHNENGEVVATAISEPVAVTTGVPEGVTADAVKLICRNLNCQILDY